MKFVEVQLSPKKAKRNHGYSQLLNESDLKSPSKSPAISISISPQPSKVDIIYREIVFITISLFMGYASLIAVQKKLYNQYESNHGRVLTNKEKQLFEHGTSLVYVGNLLFRLLHNVVFSPFTPRIRVVISLSLMCVTMFILCTAYWWFNSTAVAWVYLSYILGGIGIGSFESNLLATITPLGHQTKLWAMIGISIGFLSITVGGYGLMYLVDMNVICVYITVFCCCFGSIFLWLLRIPVPESYDHEITIKEFMSHLKLWKEWLPYISWYCFALMIDMFFLSTNTAMNQYIYDGKSFPLFGDWSKLNTIMIKQNVFLCMLNGLQSCGDILGRKIIYYYKLSVHPCYYLILSVIGSICCMSKIPIAALIGASLVMMANGLIYSSTTYCLDDHLTDNNRKYLLTSLSIWLFIGDIGSVIGSNTWQFIEPVVCHITSSSSQYFC